MKKHFLVSPCALTVASLALLLQGCSLGAGVSINVPIGRGVSIGVGLGGSVPINKIESEAEKPSATSSIESEQKKP